MWDQPLQLAFSGLCGIATNREASSKFALTRMGVGVGEVGMFVSFEMLINKELDIREVFLRILESNIPSMDIGYWMRWKLKPRDFDICSYYNKLQGSFIIVFPWKGIWKVKTRVFFFVWTVAWNME